MKYPRFRWYIMFASLIAMVVQSILMISPAPLVGEIAKSLHSDVGMVSGTVMPVWNILLAVGGVLGGFMLDRMGILKTFVISYLIMIAGSLLMPVFGVSLASVVLLRGVMGFGAGPINGCDSRVAADWFPEHERPIVTGIMGVGISLGVAVGFIYAPAMFMATHSWIKVMAWASVFCVIGLVTILVIHFGPEAPSHGEAKAEAQVSLKRVMAMPASWACFISVILLCWLFTAMNDLTPGYIALPAPMGLGHGPVLAGSIMSVFQLSFMIGCLASGFLVSGVFKGEERPVVAVGFLVAAVFCFAISTRSVAGNLGLLRLCLIVAGFFAGMPNAPIFGFIAKYYPRQVTGRLGGIAMGIGVLFGAVGVMVGAACLHNTGSYHLSIIIVSGIAFLGFLNALRLKPPTVETN